MSPLEILLAGALIVLVALICALAVGLEREVKSLREVVKKDRAAAASSAGQPEAGTAKLESTQGGGAAVEKQLHKGPPSYTTQLAVRREAEKILKRRHERERQGIAG